MVSSRQECDATLPPGEVDSLPSASINQVAAGTVEVKLMNVNSGSRGINVSAALKE